MNMDGGVVATGFAAGQMSRQLPMEIDAACINPWLVRPIFTVTAPVGRPETNSFVARETRNNTDNVKPGFFFFGRFHLVSLRRDLVGLAR